MRQRERCARVLERQLDIAFLILQFSTNVLEMLVARRVIGQEREFRLNTRHGFLPRLFSSFFLFFFFLSFVLSSFGKIVE